MKNRFYVGVYAPHETWHRNRKTGELEHVTRAHQNEYPIFDASTPERPEVVAEIRTRFHRRLGRRWTAMVRLNPMVVGDQPLADSLSLFTSDLGVDLATFKTRREAIEAALAEYRKHSAGEPSGLEYWGTRYSRTKKVS